jgi:hypothetical protein
MVHEAYSLKLREQKRFRMVGNAAMRIFGLKRDEVTEGGRKWHNDELHTLYSSSNQGM